MSRTKETPPAFDVDVLYKQFKTELLSTPIDSSKINGPRQMDVYLQGVTDGMYFVQDHVSSKFLPGSGLPFDVEDLKRLKAAADAVGDFDEYNVPKETELQMELLNAAWALFPIGLDLDSLTLTAEGETEKNAKTQEIHGVVSSKKLKERKSNEEGS